ncbi:hypothetical protein CTAM01_17252 [Colletotrichum tamarilloi]|uniref:Uncharacterized protein n=2 Tax=Colletotrichum acutatum species complex TaxID=2707335 RepID=A0ABQ9P7A4_9PEZI|nr:uncharacterized protein CTAM01_17252 [Colletotrichum tamarilloi]KAK0367496.1 hypothetical protein CLIM01_15147 [Colletotrichum limetticola]KAK1452820.1 hypothetical protein CTAM01_17252 [Colletotrichum tamarilloi]
MASATRTTALSLDENHHDDVICLGSRPSVEHITIYHKRITKSRGIRNDEDTTTGPRLRQRRDLPIYKTRKQQLGPNCTNVPDYSRTTKSDPHDNRTKSTKRDEIHPKEYRLEGLRIYGTQKSAG